MVTTVALIMMVLPICNGIPGVDRRQSKTDGDASFDKVPRLKRTMSFAEETLRRLVAMSKPIYANQGIRRNYVIKGDWESALESFYAFHPTGVQKRMTDNGVWVFKGNSDNRALTLRSAGGRGDPILDVTDYEKKREGKHIDRFIFMDHVDD